MINETVFSWNKLVDAIVEHRTRGERIVFTNGCFDILHAGHVHYLTCAKQLGDVLIVGLNSDSSVRAIKGPKRPIVPERDRAYLLAGLRVVDYVTLFDEETPARLIETLRPDILVKGADYEGKDVVGRQAVESWGGQVQLIPLVDGRGTTSVIETVLARYGPSRQ